jgi:hypothetical protein
VSQLAVGKPPIKGLAKGRQSNGCETDALVFKARFDRK